RNCPRNKTFHFSQISYDPKRRERPGCNAARKEMRKRGVRTESFDSQLRMFLFESPAIAHEYNPRQRVVAPAKAAARRQPPIRYVRIKRLMVYIAVDQSGKATHVRFDHYDQTARNEDADRFTEERSYVAYVM